MLGQLGHERDRRPDDVRGLRGHVDGQLGRRPVEVRDGSAALDRRRMRAGVVQLKPGDDVGLLEGAVGARLVADLPVVDDVVRLVFLVVADDRSALGHRLERVHDGRQRLVLDVDRLAGVLGDVRVVRDDAGYLLTLEPDLVGRQHGLSVVRQRRHPGQVAGGHHLAGQHQVDAGDVPGLAGVDRRDPRVRERAAQDLHVQHAWQGDVVGVVALAADEPVVLDPLAARA